VPRLLPREFMECALPLKLRALKALSHTPSKRPSIRVRSAIASSNLHVCSKFDDTVGGLARDAESFAILAKALYGTDRESKCTKVCYCGLDHSAGS
jgi:hypothetical protein